MSAITLILTDAGLAALTNPAHTGTSALTVTHVGLSQTPAGSIEAQKTLAVLPGEFKRLTTFGGEVMSPRVIHLSVRDESADAYQLRSFALYLSNGVLAAVVSSTDTIMEKVPATTMMQSLDLAFSRDIEAELVFGDFTFVNPPATTDRLGVVELATVEETLAGVDPSRVVTVFGLGRTLLAWAQNFAARIHGHTVGEIDGLATALQGKAASAHQHAAADVTSGTFDIARIPAIAMGGITGLVDALNGKAASNHQHAASDITSGTFSLARIPALAISNITGLVAALADKAAANHQHIADDIVSGILAVGRIPALGMEKVTGLAVALAGKAGLGEVVRFTNVALGLGNGLIYADVDRIVVRAGATGNERYFGFNTDGSFQAYNGTLHSQYGRVWDPQNFDPATKAPLLNPNFKGISWFGSDRPGKINIQGADDRAGVVEFHGVGGRIGFIGYGDGLDGNPYLGTDGNRRWLFQARPVFNGATPWDSANFNPDTKANLASPALTGNPTAPTQAASDSSTRLATTEYVQAGLNSTLAPGAVSHFARSTAPTGWLPANGAAVSRTTYAALFAAIGTTFGAGNGSTTFNVPDLRGEFIRGWDDGRGVDGGRAFGSVQADELRAHTHDAISGTGQGSTSIPAVDNDGNPANRSYPTTSTGGAETRPRNVALLPCIKF